MALKRTKDGYFESLARKPSPAQQQLALETLAKRVKPGSDLERFLGIRIAPTRTK